jgi:hypothetical protein
VQIWPPGQCFRERGLQSLAGQGDGARIAVCSGTRDVGPHRLAIRRRELRESCHEHRHDERQRLADCPRGYGRAAKSNRGMDLRFRAHGLLIRYCIIPAQATGGAFQTLAGARLLFEGDADYQLSDEIIREMQSLSPAADTNGYSASFVYRFTGILSGAHFIRLALCCIRKDLQPIRMKDTLSALWFPAISLPVFLGFTTMTESH